MPLFPFRNPISGAAGCLDGINGLSEPKVLYRVHFALRQSFKVLTANRISSAGLRLLFRTREGLLPGPSTELFIKVLRDFAGVDRILLRRGKDTPPFAAAARANSRLGADRAFGGLGHNGQMGDNEIYLGKLQRLPTVSNLEMGNRGGSARTARRRP